MKEINTVMSMLEAEYKKLMDANATDLENINGKKGEIDVLNSEISELENNIKNRQENMEKLERKIEETKKYAESISEVEGLLTGEAPVLTGEVANEHADSEPKPIIPEDDIKPLSGYASIADMVNETVPEQSDFVFKNNEEDVTPKPTIEEEPTNEAVVDESKVETDVTVPGPAIQENPENKDITPAPAIEETPNEEVNALDAIGDLRPILDGVGPVQPQAPIAPEMGDFGLNDMYNQGKSL